MDANEILMMVRVEAKIFVYKWGNCVHNISRAFRRMDTTFPKKYDWHTEKARASALLHTHTNSYIYIQTYYTNIHIINIRIHTQIRATIFQPLSSVSRLHWMETVDGTKAHYILVYLWLCVCSYVFVMMMMVDRFLLTKTIKITTKGAFSLFHSLFHSSFLTLCLLRVPYKLLVEFSSHSLFPFFGQLFKI